MKFSNTPNNREFSKPSGVKHLFFNHKRKIIGALTAIGIGTASVSHMQSVQQEVDELHDNLNASFHLNDLSNKQMALGMTFTTLYPELLIRVGPTIGRSHKVPVLRNIIKRVPQTGGILLRTPDMGSIEQIKNTTDYIRSKNPTAIVAIDFEGGYIRFPPISEELIEKYHFPELLFKIKQKEIKTYMRDPSGGSVSPFPSAEFLGKEFEELKTEAEKDSFLEMITLYGNALGLLLSDIGVHLILGPSFDTANAIGGTNENPLSKQDRSFSTNPKTVSAIGNSFVRGMRSVPGVVVVAKHFVGTGYTKNNTDITEGSTEKLVSAIIPFKDFLNDFEIDGLTQAQSKEKIKALSDGGHLHDKRKNDHAQKIAAIKHELRVYVSNVRSLTKDISNTKDRKLKKILSKKLTTARTGQKSFRSKIQSAEQAMKYDLGKLQQLVGNLKNEKSSYSFNTPIVMSGNNANNYYDKEGVPGVFSESTIKAVRYRVGASITGKRGGMGENGLVITDDLMAGGPEEYIRRVYPDGNFKALSARLAFMAGNDILLLNDTDIKTIINELENLNAQQLKRSAKRILDLKVDLGILQKDPTSGVYTVTPKKWNITPKLVKRDGLYSHQWPWLVNTSYYAQEAGKIEPISISNAVINATKNLILNQCRVDPGVLRYLCSLHPGIYETYRSPQEDSLKKRLIVIDKSTQELQVFDLETREFIEKFSIGIGKGTLAKPATSDKRVSGDNKTPAGYYQVVQKKDPALIRKTIESNLYNEYGGDKGAMLVLAGPWTPQIAIHGTLDKSTGAVSHGCIRSTNQIANHLMNSVAIGSLVVITQ